jgi:hypothetical protein
MAATQKTYQALFETPAQNTVIYSSEKFGQEGIAEGGFISLRMK